MVNLSESDFAWLLRNNPDVVVEGGADDRPSPPAHRAEHVEQALVVAWAASMGDVVPEMRLLFAVPNGGARSKATAGMLKAEGVKRGVPDLMLPVCTMNYCGLAIEMKAKGGRVSADQAWWLRRLSEQHWQVAVCYGADAAKQTIREYLGDERLSERLGEGRRVQPG